MPEQLVPVGAGERPALAVVFGVDGFAPEHAVRRVAVDGQHVVDGPRPSCSSALCMAGKGSLAWVVRTGGGGLGGGDRMGGAEVGARCGGEDGGDIHVVPVRIKPSTRTRMSTRRVQVRRSMRAWL